VKDYSANLNIKVDISFIRIVPINAVIYFKQKNKFKIKSKSILVLPKQGLDQASKLIADSSKYTCFLQGGELIDNVKTSIINIIPLSDTVDLILGKFWVDTKNNLILKSQITSKSNGTFITEYYYGSQKEFGLPDKMIFTVDEKKFKLPKGLAGEMSKAKDKSKNQKNRKTGNIYLVFTDYIVNKGISDKVFAK
jgi:hypothetical protein